MRLHPTLQSYFAVLFCRLTFQSDLSILFSSLSGCFLQSYNAILLSSRSDPTFNSYFPVLQRSPSFLSQFPVIILSYFTVLLYGLTFQSDNPTFQSYLPVLLFIPPNVHCVLLPGLPQCSQCRSKCNTTFYNVFDRSRFRKVGKLEFLREFVYFGDTYCATKSQTPILLPTHIMQKPQIPCPKCTDGSYRFACNSNTLNAKQNYYGPEQFNSLTRLILLNVDDSVRLFLLSG